jgi:hypothetical protein
VLVSLTLVSAPAAAVPVVYEFTLTPDSIGPGNPFGIPSLPAGPFKGFFSVDDSDLAEDAPFSDRSGDLLDFSITVGNTTWSLEDQFLFFFAVSDGEIVEFQIFSTTRDDLLIVSSTGGWTGFDDVNVDECTQSAPTTDPRCILGLDPDTVDFTRQALVVPEPGALPLFAAATVGLGLLLRRRRAASVWEFTARRFISLTPAARICGSRTT